MPFPRVRFTVRRTMVAVAVAGLVLGMLSRSVSRRRTAEYHRSRMANSYGISSGAVIMRDASGAVISPERSKWHSDLWLKYLEAELYPWLPVAPDPPEPPDLPEPE